MSKAKMEFTKSEICGMYTISQAQDIAKEFEEDPTWDFWEYIIVANASLFQVIESLNRRCNDTTSQGHSSMA